MRLHFLSSILLTLVTVSFVRAQNIPYQNTIKINAGDSKELIIEKAAHVVPTPNQLDALDREFIAFVHFGPNTFTRREWGTGKEDPKVFDLKELHTDQWCKAMKSAGMKLVILTVKHHDGFVLWQSRYTRHGIMSTHFENGKGDILKDLSASCKKYGLKLGIYLSPADLFQIESSNGLYGNNSPYTERTIPRAVSGRPFANKTTFKFKVDDYNEYFLNQLFELLTEYGPIDEVWFDGANPKPKGNQHYNYLAWKKVIHTLAPRAVIFGKEDIRWEGNEAGSTRETEWNVIPYAFNPDTANMFPDLTAIDLGSREELYKGKYLHYQPAETNTSIREGWFYRDDKYQNVRSTDDVFDIYERAVGGNSIFLLNVPPNRQGKFSPRDVKVLNQTGERVRKTYNHNLFSGTPGIKSLLDNHLNTYILLDKDQKEITFQTPHLVTINRFLIQESINTHGERVEQHAVDAWINGQWKEIAHATNIGFKRILRFPEVTASRFRLRILQSRMAPAIATVGGYFYNTPPPDLQIFRGKNGLVNIQPVETAFNWNPKKENAAENLYEGMTIYYTTDGSSPTLESNKFSSPFALEKGDVKAMAVINNKSGEISSVQLPIEKTHWKIIHADSEMPNHSSSQAIDENKRTYWLSAESSTNHYVTIDLGRVYKLNAFAYTPQKQNSDGMMAKGIIEISEDGNSWHDAGTFEFGNIINDPTTRKYFFNKPVSARFVRITSTEIAGGDRSLAVAELDFFEE